MSNNPITTVALLNCLTPRSPETLPLRCPGESEPVAYEPLLQADWSLKLHRRGSVTCLGRSIYQIEATGQQHDACFHTDWFYASELVDAYDTRHPISKFVRLKLAYRVAKCLVALLPDDRALLWRLAHRAADRAYDEIVRHEPPEVVGGWDKE